MSFTHPHFLWLLPLALLQVMLFANGKRRLFTIASRVFCVVLVIIALAEPTFSFRAASTTRPIAVLELGPNTTDAAHAVDSAIAAGATRAVVFSNRCEFVEDIRTLQEAQQLRELKGRIDRPESPDDAAEGGAALVQAIELAGTLIGELQSSIQLFSTGTASRGNAEVVAWRLAQRGIAVQANKLPSVRPRTAMTKVDLPTSAKLGEPVRLSIAVDSLEARHVFASATVDASNVVMREADLHPGPTIVPIELAFQHAGVQTVHIVLSDELQQVIDERSIAIDVSVPSRVLVVRKQESASNTFAALKNVLATTADVREISANDLPTVPLPNVGTLILDDVQLNALPAGTQTAIERAVSNGLGLLVVTGERTFSKPASPMEAILPVRPTPRVDRIEPSTSLVLILDTSASMRGEKLDLAKAVARIAVAHLTAIDKVGIVEFYGGKRWAAPLQSAANAKTIDRALARLTAGGGTTLYPAVEEAGFALRSVDTQGKHIVILSDGFVEDAPFESLVRDFADEGITVSTVGVKTDPQERNLMPSLAQWGRGRYYTVPDRFVVPDLSFKKPSLAPQPSVVTDVTSVVSGTDALTRNAAATDWGSVRHYTRTATRGGADIVLRTASGDPIIARWQYGQGQVAVITTPPAAASKSAQDLQIRPDFSSLLMSLIRRISGDGRNALRLTPKDRAAGIELAITSPALDESTEPLRLEIKNDQGAVVRTIDTRPVTRGTWNTLIAGLTAGNYHVNAVVSNGLKGSAAFSVTGPQALGRRIGDDTLLHRLEAFAPLAKQYSQTITSTTDVALKNPLLILAMASFVAHVAFRRSLSGLHAEARR